MSAAHTYSHADLLRWLGAQEVAKGQGYVTAVSALAVDPDRITALVQGTARRPYEVEIEFWGKGKNNGMDGYCTCPVSHDCKHVAAVLLAALARRLGTSRVNPQVLQWLEAFRANAAKAQKKPAAAAKKTADRLFYVLESDADSRRPLVSIWKGPPNADGRPGAQLESWRNIENAIARPPKFVTDEDLGLLRLLWAPRNTLWEGFPLAGASGRHALEKLLASGRLFYPEGPPLRRLTGAILKPLALGAPRQAGLVWRNAARSVKVVPQVAAEPPASGILLFDAPWYVDAPAGVAGPLQCAAPAGQLAFLMDLPPLDEADVAAVATVLGEVAPELPPPSAAQSMRVIEAEPQPVLDLVTLQLWGANGFRGYTYADRLMDCARPLFRYGPVDAPAEDPVGFFTLPGGETVRVKRDPAAEKKWLNGLLDFGLLPIPGHILRSAGLPPHSHHALESEAAWAEFMADECPRLRAAGWEVRIPPDFRHFMLEVSAWEADLAEAGNGWLSLDMGIVVEGERVPLAPLLHNLFKRDDRFLSAEALGKIGETERILLPLPDGRRVGVPAGRLKPIARTLIDLFDSIGDSGELRLSKLDAPRLEDLAALARWQFSGEAAIKEMAQKLRHTNGIQAVAPPAGLKLQLRPYQLEGLAWLQYLRQQNLSGILADDMGLGKTAQTLAHLLLEKESGRLDRPALVVLPTSLIFNWKEEAKRFAPGLRVLSLHGKDRAERFGLISKHDVILTTYPLLWRDEEAIAKHDYHLLILDEAQTVKNAASKAAQVVRHLKTRHRLCLTGTPLENHLGELWAQFDFLLPGFLGDAKQFTRLWRTPIEKYGDGLRRDVLARRVKPFILRRRKEDVAKELPPKTVIVRTLEIEGGQRDLYETVRAAMDQKVRAEIASRGFARSQIVILDALLKLRQVCCDPRLLKAVPAASKVKERAKLDLLMEMLPELVAEGRRILVFSQFTSMLALIEKELAAQKLGYALLTGDTADREGAVNRFQSGGVPIFLISLKAGGVGLNLTAADTVIHFDPWWNPAAENQATDRAHRLGQKKSVFVYKLVVSGSIEEKILMLQDKKAALAAGILSDDAGSLAKFGESDIAALLEPLPAEVKLKK